MLCTDIRAGAHEGLPVIAEKAVGIAGCSTVDRENRIRVDGIVCAFVLYQHGLADDLAGCSDEADPLRNR